MLWPQRLPQRQRLSTSLASYEGAHGRLPGIEDAAARETLISQILASIRREDYYRIIQARPISPQRANPNSPLFDAEKAVAHHLANGNADEAAWLIFLMTLFAKPSGTGWLRLKDVYGKLGAGLWDWASVSNNPAAFQNWLAANWKNIRGKFGNHRKYESLRPGSQRYTGMVVQEYVDMIGNAGHDAFFQRALAHKPNDPFDSLFRGLNIPTFGRLTKFDYLMLLSRYGVVVMHPQSAYLSGATGPSRGAKLLFTGDSSSRITSRSLQQNLDALDNYLNVGMAVLEDALCNWQKSPTAFVHFRG